MELIEKIDPIVYQKMQVELGWKFLDTKVIEKSIKNSMFVVSCIVDGQMVGIARIVGDGYTHGLLTDVKVLPAYQGRGIGKAMVTYLLNKTQEYVNKNCDEFMLELTPTLDNAAFYVKCGFKHKPEEMEGCYLWIKNQNIYDKDSKKYVMHLQEKPFKMIKSGKKTIEMRLNDEKRQKIKVGDVLIFILDSEKFEYIKAKVVALHKCPSFDELYKNFDLEKLGYKKGETGSPEDMSKYYSKESIEKYGVVGIEIKVIK